MENQHKMIKGYRDLSQEEIDLMNEVKRHGQAVGDMIQKLRGVEGLDQRWVSIAQTDFQTGFMAAVRAIGQPESF